MVEMKLEVDIKIDGNRKIYSGRKPLNFWSSERIKEEIVEFSKGCSDSINVTSRLLSEGGRGDLARAIARHYQGGWPQLRQDLGWNLIKKPNKYWSKENIEAEARRFYEEEGKLTFPLINSRGNRGFAMAIIESYPGGITKLKELLEIPIEKRPNGSWTIEKIEEEARKFIGEHGDLSTKLLRGSKKNTLMVYIAHKYPGGMTALKQKLGVPLRRKDNYWTKEIIERETAVFLNDNDGFTSTILMSKRSDLWNAIRNHYPGRYKSLCEKIGVDFGGGRNSWTAEQIEIQAREFYFKFGELSGPLLSVHNRKDLLSAIRKRYLGGLVALQTKLCIDTTRKPDGYWKNIENIEREAKTFYEREGSFTQIITTEKGASSLWQAIYKYYPGGFPALSQKIQIALARNHDFWTIEKIEEEALEIYRRCGTLSASLLTREGKGGLRSAVAKHYPGQMIGLKVRLGIILPKEDIISPEEANEDLDRLFDII